MDKLKIINKQLKLMNKFDRQFMKSIKNIKKLQDKMLKLNNEVRDPNIHKDKYLLLWDKSYINGATKYSLECSYKNLNK